MIIRKFIKLTVISVILIFCLASCDILDKLGFDTYDYMSESVTKSYGADSEIAGLIENMLNIIITDSIYLPEFENMHDAIELYRDAILSHMLKSEYAKYSGNVDLISKASKEYPEYQITQIIPADEFESTMYEYFGGDVKITHKNGSIFKYLKNVNAYICTLTPEDSKIYPKIDKIDETEKTYRVQFKCISDNETSSEYFALIIKRADGTYYFKKLYSL